MKHHLAKEPYRVSFPPAEKILRCSQHPLYHCHLGRLLRHHEELHGYPDAPLVSGLPLRVGQLFHAPAEPGQAETAPQEEPAGRDPDRHPLAFGYAAQTLGLHQTTASNSAFITGTYVVLIPLIAWLFTRKLQTRQLLIAIVACLGLAALSLDENLRVNTGDWLVLAGAFGYAVHFLVLDHYTKEYDSLLISGLQIFVCTLLLILTALLFEPLPTAANFPPSVIQALLFTAAFGSAMGFLVQTAVQKVLAPTQASILFTSESIFGALFGVLLLQEHFIPRQLLGGAVLVVCMVASVVEPKRPKQAASA